MLRIFWVCFLFSIAVTAPTMKNDLQSAQITKYENHIDGKGNYEFSFETSDGILRRESGVVINKGESDEHLSVEGEYTYTDPEGTIHVIRYQADKNGFELLPPSMPPVIASLPSQVVATMLG